MNWSNKLHTFSRQADTQKCQTASYSSPVEKKTKCMNNVRILRGPTQSADVCRHGQLAVDDHAKISVTEGRNVEGGDLVDLLPLTQLCVSAGLWRYGKPLWTYSRRLRRVLILYNVS